METRATSLDAVPNGIPPESVRLYFGITEDKGQAVEVQAAGVNLVELATIRAEVACFPRDTQAKALPLLMDLYKLRFELESLQGNTGLKNDHQNLTREHEDLKRSVVARVANSTSSMPSAAECLELFERHLATTTTRESTATHVRLAQKFLASLPTTIKKLAEIRPDHVGTFIDRETARTIRPSRWRAAAIFASVSLDSSIGLRKNTTTHRI